MVYNDSAVHSLPVIQNLITNTLLSMLQIGSNITTYTFPWPNVDGFNPAALGMFKHVYYHHENQL